MLITKTVTHTHKEEQQIELNVPYFSKEKAHSSMLMICRNGDVIQLRDTQVTIWKSNSMFNKEAISDAVSGTEITEEEFMTAYDAALRGFEASMFPEVIEEVKTDSELRYSDGSIVNDKPF